MIKNSANEIIEFNSTEHFNKIIEENEKVVAGALTDLNSRTEIIEDEFATTYRIYFSDENYADFSVNNGRPGDQGEPGDRGEMGEPGRIGDQGAPGLDGYDGSNVVVASIIIGGVCALLALIVLGARVFKRNPFAL